MVNLLSRLRGKAEPEIARGMTLDQYLRQVLSSWQQGYSAPTTYFTERGQPAERIEATFQEYAQFIYAAHPIIFGLMEARRSVFSEARFCWRAVKNGNPGDVLPINDGLELLENPWPGATTGTLLDRMRQDADLGGTAFVVRQTGSDGKERLRRLRPDWVQIVLSGDPWHDAFVDFLGITYAPNGPNNSPVEPFLADEVSVFAPIPDPLAQFRGMSWLSPVLREIAADKSATAHRDSTLRQGGWLGPIVRPPQGTTLDQFKKFVEAADARHAGPNNAGKMVFLAPGSEITTVAQSLRDLDIRAVTGAVETRLAVAARIPAVIAGISEGLQGSSLNAGNYNAAKRAWIDTGLRPDWRKLCEALSVITPPPDLSKLDLEPGTEAQLWILESDIALLHEDRLDAAQVRSANATTINTLVTAGFKPETIVTAVRDDDLSALEHTGLTSVQLTPPGTTPGQPGQSPSQPDTQGEAAYQQALQELRASRAAFLDAKDLIRAQTAGQTGAMVALVPSEQDAQRLAVDGGLPADELHLTLFYLGDASGYPASLQRGIVDAVRAAVARHRALELNAFGGALWNPQGDEPTWVLNVADPWEGASQEPLSLLRKAVGDALTQVSGFSMPHQHTPWAPHVSLAQGADAADVDTLARRVGPVTFDHVRVAFGGRTVDIPLGDVKRSASGPWSRHPHPGQRYRHGFIPVGPVALLSPDMLDGEFGQELDSVDWLDHRLVAREHGVTVESPQGSDIAVHSVLSPHEAEDVADAIDQGQPYARDRVEVVHHGDGVSVRFGGIDEDLDQEQAAELASHLHDLGYQVEDAANPPNEPDLPEQAGDETPLPDAARSQAYAASLASLRAEVDEIRRG